MHEEKEPEKPLPSNLESRFEFILWSSRLLVMLAVVPSLLGAAVLFLIGTADVLGIVADIAAEDIARFDYCFDPHGSI